MAWYKVVRLLWHSTAYPNRPAITRLGMKSEDDFFFKSSSCHFNAVFICFVPKRRTRLVIKGVLVGDAGGER